MWSKEIFARNLARYMEQYQLSRKDLSAKIGVPYSTISEWLNAKKFPRIDKIEMLANLFNCLKSDLIEDKTQEQEVELTPKDLNEVAQDLEKIIDGLDATYGAAGYGGTISDDDKETLRDALFMAMKIAKRQAKEKYTPKKYRSNKDEKT